MPIYNYFQAALILFEDGLLTSEQILFVARDMISSGEHEAATLATSLQDLLRRGRLSHACAEKLSLALHGHAGSAADAETAKSTTRVAWAFAERVRALGGSAALEWPDANQKLNYVELVDAEYQRRRDKSRRRSRSR